MRRWMILQLDLRVTQRRLGKRSGRQGRGMDFRGYEGSRGEGEGRLGSKGDCGFEGKVDLEVKKDINL
jgi:hypothetical protein